MSQGPFCCVDDSVSCNIRHVTDNSDRNGSWHGNTWSSLLCNLHPWMHPGTLFLYHSPHSTFSFYLFVFICTSDLLLFPFLEKVFLIFECLELHKILADLKMFSIDKIIIITFRWRKMAFYSHSLPSQLFFIASLFLVAPQIIWYIYIYIKVANKQHKIAIFFFLFDNRGIWGFALIRTLGHREKNSHFSDNVFN